MTRKFVPRPRLTSSFVRADVPPRAASPCIIFWTFRLLSFFLLEVDNDFFVLKKKQKIYTSKGEHGWGEITKVIKSTITFQGGGGSAIFYRVEPKILRSCPTPNQAINDWSPITRRTHYRTAFYDLLFHCHISGLYTIGTVPLQQTPGQS